VKFQHFFLTAWFAFLRQKIIDALRNYIGVTVAASLNHFGENNGILLHGYDVIVEAFTALKHFKLCFFEKSLGSFLLFTTELT